nr:hypothetical protein [uncultured Desulfobacter sp.]
MTTTEEKNMLQHMKQIASNTGGIDFFLLIIMIVSIVSCNKLDSIQELLQERQKQEIVTDNRDRTPHH